MSLAVRGITGSGTRAEQTQPVHPGRPAPR
jgi:hypothetical protein